MTHEKKYNFIDALTSILSIFAGCNCMNLVSLWKYRYDYLLEDNPEGAILT
jgi:hypothetical protein